MLERIRAFEKELDENHEVGLKLAAFGTAVTLVVTDIAFTEPNTLVFYGLMDGNRATLVQHMTQLNLLLVAVPKSEPERPPRRIGFALPEE